MGNDVNEPDPSAGNLQDPGSDPQNPDSSSVNTDDAANAGKERPIQNLKAEFDRKTGKLEQQVQQIVAYLATLAQNQPARTNSVAAEAAPKDEVSDKDLMSMFREGHDEAGEILIERQVKKHLSKSDAKRDEEQLVLVQKQALYSKYKVLSDPNHPLTQAAMVAKYALRARGEPNNHATDVKAILIAIADNPEIIAQIAGTPAAASEAARVSASRGIGAMGGASVRRPAPKSGTGVRLSEKELAIAKRMGVKDPAKSRERMLKRMEEGKSGFSPTVNTIVKEEE